MDSVTLITRPRRFGKTLTMNMLEHFLSLNYAGKGELFSGLNIWREEKYRNLQGTCPVISLSFASVKGSTYEETKAQICQLLADLYIKNDFLKNSGFLAAPEIKYFDRVSKNMPEANMAVALHKLCDFMQRYYRKKAIILEFKVHRPKREKDLEETVQAALLQIEEKNTPPLWRPRASRRNVFENTALRLRERMF